MAIRKTRRQVVRDAASIAAIVAVGAFPTPVADAAPVPAPTVNGLMRKLLDGLVEDLSPDTGHRTNAAAMLRTEFTLSSVWSDLCEMSGESLPADVEATLNAPVGEPLPELWLEYSIDARIRALGRLHGLKCDAIRIAHEYQAGGLHAEDMTKGLKEMVDEAFDLGERSAVKAKVVEYRRARAS